MSNQLVSIQSVAQIHEIFGLGKPQHPLVSLIEVKDMHAAHIPAGYTVASDLYSIWLKDGSCGIQYGRNFVDFDSGVLLMTAPGQVFSSAEEWTPTEVQGWLLVFHPDLIRRSPLGQEVEHYNFFSYESHEALHLSDDEEATITDCAHKIRQEYQQRIDNHSQKVMVATLDLMLSYCNRYYERQFNTRSTQHKDVVVQVESILKNYLNNDLALEHGAPTIQYLADQVSLSAGYLSDLLKKETGKSGKDFIHYYLIEKAKTRLLNSEETINEIAYSLGFNYPHYFSRLFKAKTGMSPQEFRTLN